MTSEQQDLHFEIVNGPSLWDLMLASFDQARPDYYGQIRERYVIFKIKTGHMKRSKTNILTNITVVIRRYTPCKRKRISDSEWNKEIVTIEGECNNASSLDNFPRYVKIQYSPQTRKGEVSISHKLYIE